MRRLLEDLRAAAARLRFARAALDAATREATAHCERLLAVARERGVAVGDLREVDVALREECAAALAGLEAATREVGAATARYSEHFDYAAASAELRAEARAALAEIIEATA